MKYHVTGADRDTGEDLEIIIEAKNPAEAELAAKRRNLMVSGVAAMAPSQPEPVRSAPPRPTPVQSNEWGHSQGAPSVNVHLPRRGSSLGVAALVLGIISLFFVWIPFINLIAVVLAAVGLLMAVIGLFVSLARKGSGIGYPIAGGVVCAIPLVFGIILTFAAINAREAIVKANVDRALRNVSTNQQLAGDGSNGADPGAGTPATPAGISWAPASEAVRQGDVTVQITEVRVGSVKMSSGPGRDGVASDEPLLKVTLRVTNTSANRKIEMRSWSNDSGWSRDTAPALADNFENDYSQKGTGMYRPVGGLMIMESVYPGKSVVDVVAFQAPVDGIEFVRLELPAMNFGGDGMIRFEIPASMIQR